MPTYTFKLRDNDGALEDATGVSLPNAESAFSYASDVVGELMDRREDSTRDWQLDVYEDGRQVFAIPFANLDHTLDHLSPEHRETVEVLAKQSRLLKDARHEARMTRREAQALVARSRGKPYLAADRGRKIIRDE